MHSSPQGFLNNSYIEVDDEHHFNNWLQSWSWSRHCENFVTPTDTPQEYYRNLPETSRSSGEMKCDSVIENSPMDRKLRCMVLAVLTLAFRNRWHFLIFLYTKTLKNMFKTLSERGLTQR